MGNGGVRRSKPFPDRSTRQFKGRETGDEEGCWRKGLVDNLRHTVTIPLLIRDDAARGRPIGPASDEEIDFPASEDIEDTFRKVVAGVEHHADRFWVGGEKESSSQGGCYGRQISGLSKALFEA